MKTIRTIITLLLFVATSFQVAAQRHETLRPGIMSLQVIANDDWQAMPIIELGNGHLDISFDDFTHEYHRYMYRIEHCEADWQTTESLFDSEFCRGFARDNIIEDYQESLLTNALYLHYHITLPNENCRMTMSGNYRLTVYDNDEDDEPVLTACFMVVEPRMGVSLGVTTNTDIDINMAHQQVTMELRYGNTTVTNPQEQLTTVLLQNQRWDNARWNAKPQYILPDRLRWEHCRDYIFDGGNEYRKFEILSTDVASMGIDRLYWDGSLMHAYPFLATPRLNYLYDESANGAFLLRNSDNYEAETTSDYLLVHIRLEAKEELPYDVYVNGQFTNDHLDKRYRMIYFRDLHLYEATFIMKLGYYSYQFLMIDKDGNPRPLPSEGNFYQTKNNYQALVYFREPGGRTDRLVAFQEYKMN